jgi:uncharacterized RDD family membrane protein YckC
MSRPYDDYRDEPRRPVRDDYDYRDSRREAYSDERDYRRRRDDYEYADYDDRRYGRDPYDDDRGYGRRFYRGSPLAGRGARLAAQILDFFFLVLAALPGIGLMIVMAMNSTARYGPRADEMLPGILLLILGIVGLGIYQIVLLSTQGQTLGKRAMGIRIVRYDDERNAGFLGAWFLRSFVNGIICMVPYIGPFYRLVDILCIFGEEQRCLHDQLASTKVIVARAR